MLAKMCYFTFLNKKEKIIEKRKNVRYLTFFLFCLKYLVITGIVFLSWNYFSPFFVIVLYFLFDIINKYHKNSFKNFFFHYLLYIVAFHLGVVFWMFWVEDGIIAIFISLLYYLLPFFVYLLFNRYVTNILFVELIEHFYY